MLAHAARGVGGAGWAFGLHEALDQIGATLGPLIAALVLFLHGGYRHAFAWLLLPALAAMATLAIARVRYPEPHALDPTPLPRLDDAQALRQLKVFLVATALIAAGCADFALIAFHLTRDSVMPAAGVPVLYALGNIAAGAAALLLGRAFDRRGPVVLLWATAVPALYAPLVFLGGEASAILGMVLWGVGFGAHDALLRAAVAQRIAPGKRASVMGVFNAIYGLAWFLGSALLGVLYDVDPVHAVIAAAALQLAACPLLWSLRGQTLAA
jgi:predicted MFS family arabinose efflux permease